MATSEGPNQLTQLTDQPTAGITKFTDDTIGTLSEPIVPAQPPNDVLSLAEVDGAQTIIDFLKRPTRIATGSLATTDSTKLFEVDPWVLQLSGVKGQKLSGVGLMRADIVVRLEVNAVRFQAGRYILAWFPYGGRFSNGAAGMYRSHTINLQTITQLPHVEIDLAKETHVSLRIPFTSNAPYLPVTTTLFAYGVLFLVPYVALIAGASDSTCSYTAWASFDNVKLTAPAIPQSSFSMSVSRKEQKAAGTGPISEFAAKVSKTASVLGEIPLLTPVMSTVSWAAGIAGKAASLWGFSKPVVLSQPVRYVREIFPYMANSDNGTSGLPLALVASNEVPIKNPVATSNLDEMSIDFIKSQWAYAGQFNWTTSQTTDTALATIYHNPRKDIAVGSGYTNPPITFLANIFTYWRGSIKIRFKLVKTEFHSGRLMVSYSPTFGFASPTWSIANTEYIYREIVDIRDLSEFEVTVPYVVPDPWIAEGERSAGTLMIHVLDPLIAPDTVSSTVPIVYEVAGGPDLEFAFPRDFPLQPWVPAVAMSSFSMSHPDVYQKAPVADLGKTVDNIAASYSVGEKINSLRQLLKRATIWTASYNTNAVSVSNGADWGVACRPFTVDVVGQWIGGGNTGALYRGTTLPDQFSTIAMCYFANSGSVNIRALLQNPRSTGSEFIRTTMKNDTVSYPASSLYQEGKAILSTDMRHMTLANTDPRVDVVVPQYFDRYARITHANIVSPVWGVTPNTTAAQTSTCANGRSRVLLHIDTLYNDYQRDWQIARPIGDDFSFFGWLGVPAVCSPLAS